MRKLFTLLLLVVLLSVSNQSYAQGVWDPVRGCFYDASAKKCLPNTILSSLSFLRIVPDTRSGALGDAGIALSPDANAMHFNASKLAFAENDFSISATYTPWLKNIGVQDVYLAYLSGFKQIDKNQSIGASLRFFSMGQIEFRNDQGGFTGTGKPREFEVALAYARRLSNSFSASLTTKYIYSNLAGGQEVNSIDIRPANSFAVDLGFTYFHDIKIGDMKTRMRYGLALTNLGSKVSYLKSIVRDFIPANIGIGTAMEINIDEYNSFTLTVDINKLMIPTPVFNDDGSIIDVDPANGYSDYRDKSLFAGMLGSFTDAKGGAKEELQELMYSIGVEYWYAKQFAVRTGYYYEHPLKGNRKFLSAGLGFRYNVYEMNLSYLIPTSNQQNPLDNTYRFSLIFNLKPNDK